MAEQIFGTMGIIFAITFLVEALTEYVFGTVFDKIPKITPYKWTLMYISLTIGVLVSFYYQFDLIAILAQAIGADTITMTAVGIFSTGLVIGRGSAFLHQFVSRFFPQKP